MSLDAKFSKLSPLSLDCTKSWEGGSPSSKVVSWRLGCCLLSAARTCPVGQYFEGHCMPTVSGNANKVFQGLWRFAGKRSIINMIEHRLIPMESKHRADINGIAEKNQKRDGPVQRLAHIAIENQEGCILQAEQPTRGRVSGSIKKQQVGNALQGLVSAFHNVLILAVRLAPPISNT
jgi:hypothetical protein